MNKLSTFPNIPSYIHDMNTFNCLFFRIKPRLRKIILIYFNTLLKNDPKNSFTCVSDKNYGCNSKVGIPKIIGLFGSFDRKI